MTLDQWPSGELLPSAACMCHRRVETRLHEADVANVASRQVRVLVHGMLRQFFPKGQVLRQFSAEDLLEVAHLMDTRLRKRWAGRTQPSAWRSYRPNVHSRRVATTVESTRAEAGRPPAQRGQRTTLTSTRRLIARDSRLPPVLIFSFAPKETAVRLALTPWETSTLQTCLARARPSW